MPRVVIFTDCLGLILVSVLIFSKIIGQFFIFLHFIFICKVEVILVPEGYYNDKMWWYIQRGDAKRNAASLFHVSSTCVILNGYSHSWGQIFLCSTWNPQGPVRCCMLLKSLWKEVKRGRKKEGVMKTRKGKDGRNWRTKGKEREKRTEKRIVIPECLWEISACLFKCLMLELVKTVNH